MTPAKAFGFGMALFPVQIKDLAIFVACVNLIATASLGPRGSTVALVLVLLVLHPGARAHRPILWPCLVAVPHRASKILGSLRARMEKNNRTLTVVLCLVFVAFFLVRCFSGL